MAPKHHPTPLSGGDRKALRKELASARAMTTILNQRAVEKRAAGEALIREADDLTCKSWNEKMWADDDRSTRRRWRTNPSSSPKLTG